MQWLQRAACQSTTCVLVMGRVGGHLIFLVAISFVFYFISSYFMIGISRIAVKPYPEGLGTGWRLPIPIGFRWLTDTRLLPVAISVEVVGLTFPFTHAAGYLFTFNLLFPVIVALCVTAEFGLLRRICPHSLPLDALTGLDTSGIWPTKSPR